MKRSILLLLLLLLAIPAAAANVARTEEQKTLYAIGLVVAQQLSTFNLTAAELEFVKQGLTDSVTGKKPLAQLDEYNQKIQELARARHNALGEKLAAEAKGFTEKASQAKGAIKTASGMIYVMQKEGNGSNPTVNDKVKVHYNGTLVNGSVFDSSYKRGQPLEFAVNGVIPCWTEGLQMMKPGGKARLICPPAIAYGERGTGPIPPNATLVFDVELLEVKQ
jgi:FKBP-type peptidyl-prolyl cis-trans isomerase FkpA